MHRLNFQRVVIVGTGLLGGSIGLALRQAGLAQRIVGVGRRQATLRRAAQLGCIDESTTDLAQATPDADLILLATPLGALPATLQQLADCPLAESALITDVGSTKRSIVDAAERLLPSPARFVGSHPMAGAETNGPDAARPDLLRGKPVVLTPTDRTHPDALQTIESLWIALGMRPLRMTPADHDEAAARISHLPHAAAALLVDAAANSTALDLASTGFADTTRVASADPHLWTDIFLNNRDALLKTLDDLADRHAALRRMIDHEDRDQLLTFLQSAKTTRDHWLHQFQQQAHNAPDDAD